MRMEEFWDAVGVVNPYEWQKETDLRNCFVHFQFVMEVFRLRILCCVQFFHWTKMIGGRSAMIRSGVCTKTIWEYSTKDDNNYTFQRKARRMVVV